MSFKDEFKAAKAEFEPKLVKLHKGEQKTHHAPHVKGPATFNQDVALAWFFLILSTISGIKPRPANLPKERHYRHEKGQDSKDSTIGPNLQGEIVRVFDLLKGGFFHVPRIKSAEMPRPDSQPGMVANHTPSGGPVVEQPLDLLAVGRGIEFNAADETEHSFSDWALSGREGAKPVVQSWDFLERLLAPRFVP